MSVLFIIAFSVVIILMSRFVFKFWFNPISFYSLIWCLILTLFELKLIDYYSLEIETWTIIIVSWLLFVTGAITIYLIFPSENQRLNLEYHNPYPVLNLDIHRLKFILWILNIVSLIAALYNLYLVTKITGGLLNAFIIGNLLYSYRVAEGIPGSLPYIGSIVYTAAAFAGVYSARVQKISLVGIFPIINIIIIDFAIMGRADILIVSILSATAYFVTPKSSKSNKSTSSVRFRKVLLIVVLLSVIIGGAELIRSTRSAKEGFRGSTGSLKKLSSSGIITPSIYLYFSSSIGVLNQYFIQNKEDVPIGSNMFLTLYRIFERFGVDVHAEIYQQWYKIPTPVNTGTYLRELHGDFGIPGILFGPYLLGVFSSFFWLRFKENGRFIDLSFIAFFFGIIGLSFIVIATRLGGYFFFPFIAIPISMFLDRRVKSQKLFSTVEQKTINIFDS